jgi:hypothetical protein
MIRFKSLTNSPRAVLPLALLLTATFGASCGGAKRNPASDSSAASSAPPSSTAGAGAVFEGTITAKMSGEKQPAEIRYAIKGNRTRFEVMSPQGGSQMSVMLMDMSSGAQTTLIPRNKTYMTMNWREMADEITKVTGKGASGDFPKVTSTGKTDTVAGLTCRHWLFGDKQDMDMCLANGMGYFGFGGQSGGMLDKLKNLALRDKIKAQLDTNPEFAKFVEGGAFPLKMERIENGQSKTIMEVTSVERKSLDDSLFTVPADYKKIEIPGMPGIPEARR